MIEDYLEYELVGKEKKMIILCGYLAVAFVVYLFYHSILISAIGGFAVRFLIPYYKKYKGERRRAKLELQFKDLLYSLSASFSSGRHMREALSDAAENLGILYGTNEPIMKEIRHINMCMRENNESDSILLEDFARRSRSEDISNFVQVYVTCRNLGGDLVSVISRCIDILTDKMIIKDEIKAITSQKKFEGRLISAMPITMLTILNITSSTYIEPLYETLGGRIIMTVALGVSIWGLWLMEKISKIEI